MVFNRLFAGDEELGKKDDDFRPQSHGRNVSESYGSGTPSWLAGPRSRRRRLAILVGAIALLYLFIHNMPDPLGPVGNRVDSRDPTRTIRGDPVRKPIPEKPFVYEDRPKSEQTKELNKELEQGTAQSGKGTGEESNPAKSVKLPELKSEDIPPNLRGGLKTAEHYYDGELRFFELSKSLNDIFHTSGFKEDNKNVLFAASTVESASRLIPLACEMARYNRNYVHFTFMGRDPIDMDTLRELNGAAGKECSVFWHDARPDESVASTDQRMEYSVTSALYHINSYVHPQVYLMDNVDNEEQYFVKTIRAHASRVGKSLIDLPVDAAERMRWITRLDHSSLAAWDSVYIDILIHVAPDTAGSLIRLLRTISKADYFGTRTPHLTIELPSQLDPAAERFLDGFVWPPLPKEGGKHVSKVTLRRRVSTAHLTPLEASIRTVESFYSARPHQSHVLLLSTQAELSPMYYQYLFYNVLEYGYGWYARTTYEHEHLAGISLELPGAKLDGSPFTAPSPSQKKEKADAAPPDLPFLWQAPNTNAALYFGHRWKEFHNYLSHRIALPPPEPSKKMVSTAFPAFTEPLLELMRARNYFMLYPHLPDGKSVVSIHNELASVPEEYTYPEGPQQGKPDALYKGATEPSSVVHSNEGNLFSEQLVALLPDDGDLPELQILDLLSWNGESIDAVASTQQAKKYASTIRRNIGGCSTEEAPAVDVGTNFAVDDLFCRQPGAAGADLQEGQPPVPTKTYAPVRAGIEAAIAAYSGQIPNALLLTPTPNARVRLALEEAEAAKKAAAGDTTLDLKALENSNLEFDMQQPPNPATPGEIRKGASMEEIFEAERAKARKQMGSKDGSEQQPQQLTPNNGPNGPGGIPADLPGNGASRGRHQEQGQEGEGKSEVTMVDGYFVKKVSEEEREAMQKEFRAHLGRLSKDSEEEPSKGREAGKEKEKEAEKALNRGLR